MGESAGLLPGALSIRAETLHPAPWAPGYFDGLPVDFRGLPLPQPLRTGNVQLFSGKDGQTALFPRIGGP